MDTPTVETPVTPVVETTTAPVVETQTATVDVTPTPPTPAPAWDGRRDTLTTLPYWSTLAPDVQTSILSGLDTVESKWSESVAAAEKAERERSAAQAIADLLDARDIGSVDMARDTVMLRNQLEALTAERNAAVADYEAKLKAATDGHQLSQAELTELRNAKAALEAATAERDAKLAEREAAIAERDTLIAQQKEAADQLQVTAITNHLWETRPDLKAGDEIKRLEVQSRFFDILVNPLVDGDLEKAYRYLAVEMPPPPKPDPVPDAVALMNNGSAASASLTETLNRGSNDPMAAYREMRRKMENDAIRADNM